ncbi:MAG: UbiA family prenyltransferase [Bacteroidota bacterium]
MIRHLVRFLKLIRLPNLLVVVATQLLVYYRVFLPAYTSVGFTPKVSEWRLWQLIVITIAISASGFIINDLRDAKVDEINRPGTNPVPALGRDLVQWLYALSVLGGFLLSLIVAFRLNELPFLWLYPLSVGLLALYSWFLKGLPLVGNIVIGLYCACVPGIIGLAERARIYKLVQVAPGTANKVMRTLFIFMLFAFLATWLRELAKDIEDREGDQKTGLKTFPVLFGTRPAQVLAQLIALATAFALLVPILFRWPSYASFYVQSYLYALLAGLLVISWLFYRAKTTQDWHNLSTGLKLYLLLGLGLLASFW